MGHEVMQSEVPKARQNKTKATQWSCLLLVINHFLSLNLNIWIPWQVTYNELAKEEKS
jgi:hypothetical protein